MNDVSKLVLAVCLPVVLLTTSFKVLNYVRDNPTPKFKAGDCVVITFKQEFKSDSYHERIVKVGKQHYLISYYDKYSKFYEMNTKYLSESSITITDSDAQLEECLK